MFSPRSKTKPLPQSQWTCFYTNMMTDSNFLMNTQKAGVHNAGCVGGRGGKFLMTRRYLRTKWRFCRPKVLAAITQWLSCGAHAWHIQCGRGREKEDGRGKEWVGEGHQHHPTLVRAGLFRPHPFLRGCRQLMGKLDSTGELPMELLVSCLSSCNSSTSTHIQASLIKCCEPQKKENRTSRMAFWES